MTEKRLTIRPCRSDETHQILGIVNAAAQAYRGHIPDDRWHDPYMSSSELAEELAAGVAFTGCEVDGVLVGVMGIQPVRDVDLIRHAYVQPSMQGHGVGGVLLEHLKAAAARRLLVGTWAAAEWAIRFYERHGFQLSPPKATRELLKAYWNIPERQLETSVVLEGPSPASGA